MVKAAVFLGCISCLFLLGGCGKSKVPEGDTANATSSQPSTGGAGGSGDMPGASSGQADASSTMDGTSSSAQMGNTQMGGSGYGAGYDASNSGGMVAGYPGSEGGYPGGVAGSPGAMQMPGFGSNESPGGYSGDGYGGSQFGGQFGGQRQAAPKKLTLNERAVVAFKAGNTKRAYALLGASAIQASDEQAAEVSSQYRWAQNRKRPQLGLNIAFGATIKNPQNNPDLAPISSGGANQGSPGMMGMGMGMGMGTGADGSASGTAQKSFEEVAGALGKQLVQALSDKHSESAWSEAFHEHNVGKSGNPSSTGEMGGMGGMSGYGQGGPGGPGGMPTGSGDGYGSMPSGIGMGMGGDPAASPPSRSDVQLPVGFVSIGPCMTYIGVDEKNKLIKKAHREGFDCLVIFEVEISFNRVLNKTLNETSIRVIIPNEVVKDAESIYSSKKLSNLQVATAKAMGKPDGVDEVIQMVVKKTHDKLAMQEIPAALTPEIILKKRIPALIDDKDTSSLERLSEITFYYSKGFIDENEKTESFEKIVGQSGKVLATGSAADKLAAIEKLLEK